MKRLRLSAFRVFRGGHWYRTASVLRALHAGDTRTFVSPYHQNNNSGARFVRGKR